jgi:hypothetical protein
VMAGQNSR